MSIRSRSPFFFFNDTATTEIYTLSLHDALPICPHTAHPITEAGVIQVPRGDREELGKAIVRVLTDEPLWQDLHQRNLRAQQEYFSWDAIAERYATLLMHE